MPPFTPLPRKLENRFRARMGSSVTAASPLDQVQSIWMETASVTAPASETLHQRYSTSSAVLVGTAPAAPEVWPDHFPDLPPAAVWILAGGLSFLFVGAICLLMINFYPHHPRGHRVKAQRGYTEVAQEDFELDSYCASRVPITPDWQMGRPHHAQTGVDSSPRVDEFASMLRKRRPTTLSIDTTAQYKGLGIAVQGGKAKTAHAPPPPRRSSSEDTVPSRSCSTASSSSSSSLRAPPHAWTPLPSPLIKGHHGRTRPRAKKSTLEPRRQKPSIELELVETFCPRPGRDSDQQRSGKDAGTARRANAATEQVASASQYQSSRFLDLDTHQQHMSELEAGTFLDVRHATGWPNHSLPEDPPPETPYVTPEESPRPSRTSSTLNLLLQKGEDAVDYTARKLTRMVYDQVNKNDLEEGLLLPIRRCETEGIAKCEVCCDRGTLFDIPKGEQLFYLL
ncbi:hypothetical protein Slin15195_G046940 [Septoria linicola]|uniref:Uncharacterized protein n=1 Tax=Septoria linicola TaxID=215465 RepID=A0A9Q9EHV7_9PEZI|nr:hypothetical protein Slin14017_G050470 [Septoria linicola]USW51375.1 hypothetical protein Slin15195_G046940 [Septoria linicola]